MKRDISNAVLLSLIHDRLLCPFVKFHSALETLYGRRVLVHEAGFIFDDLSSRLQKQFPDLAAYDLDHLTRNNVEEWKAANSELLAGSQEIDCPIIKGV